MTKFETMYLKPGKEKALGRRHPWVFSGAFRQLPEHLEEGSLVKIMDSNERFKAIGFFRRGSVAVMILSFEDSDNVQSLISAHLTQAISYRKRIGLLDRDGTDCCRLVFGEGDQLPGLIIDKYAQTAVIQTHHAGWAPFLDLIKGSLNDEFVKYFYHKPAGKMEQSEKGWLGNKPEENEIREYGHRFVVDWEEGQKTGFFLDQRENRQRLATLAKDKNILNTFSYTGGFSVYALANGAKNVTSVDISQPAVDLANTNAEINGFSSRHTGITSDVLQYLKNKGGDFDIIILDPPAFSKSRRTIHKALQAYKRLNSRAISTIKTGGLIFTFSCSQHMTAQLFEDTIRAAAIEAGRPVRIVERLGQPADHPVNIYHPEGAYLKGLILAVD